METNELLAEAKRILRDKRPDLGPDIDAGRILFVVDGEQSVRATIKADPIFN